MGRPHCKGMAIEVARRGARRSGERTLRIPPSCNLPVSHACGPRVASFVRRSSTCAPASMRACRRAWRAAQCESSRKKERPAKKGVGVARGAMRSKKGRPAKRRVGTLNKKEARHVCVVDRTEGSGSGACCALPKHFFVAQGDSARDHSPRSGRPAARVVILPPPGVAGTCLNSLS